MMWPHKLTYLSQIITIWFNFTGSKIDMNHIFCTDLGFWEDLKFFKQRGNKKSSLNRDHHLECSPISNSAICGNGSVINSKSVLFPKQRKHIQGHHVLRKITHPVAVSCSGNLCANINGHSEQQDPAEINPETTLIQFTQEEINIALVGVKVDRNQWLWETISMWGSATGSLCKLVACTVCYTAFAVNCCECAFNKFVMTNELIKWSLKQKKKSVSYFSNVVSCLPQNWFENLNSGHL